MRAVTLRTLSHLISVTSLAALFALGAGCAGSDGDPGSPGSSGGTGAPGQPGTPGSAGTVTAANAERLDITITGVTISAGKPTINFKVVDPFGKGVTGIAKADSRFSMARLSPGVNGKSSEWRSYVTSTNTPPSGAKCPISVTDPTATGPCPGTTPTKQATAEVASAAGAIFTESANGVYSYTFAKALPDYDGVAYDATLTHRAGVEIRTPNPLYNANNPLNNVSRYVLSNNPTYDFQPSTGATSGIPNRLIVNNAECNACHGRLAIHGEGRFDIPYCSVCHNPYTTDAESTNTVDLKVMIHKIHRGEDLPSVALNKPYYVYGFGGAVDFSEVVFPQDLRNCTTCHRETDPSTPDASNWRKTVNSTTCGACHDNINFQTGVGHPAALDSDCATCHGPDATYDGGKWRTQSVHFDPYYKASQDFQFQIVKVEAVDKTGAIIRTCTPSGTPASCVAKVAPGEFPQVTIKVVNPNTGAAYNILDAAGPFGTTTGSASASINARIAWNTQNLVSHGSSTSATSTPTGLGISFLATSSCTSPCDATTAPPPPLSLLKARDNGDGTFTKPAFVAIGGLTPAQASGSGVVTIYGAASMPIKPSVGDPAAQARVAVRGTDLKPFPMGDASVVARRVSVDSAKCAKCHVNVGSQSGNNEAFHGASRAYNAQLCTVCHNPEKSGWNHLSPTNPVTPAGATAEEIGMLGLTRSADSKVFFHRLHGRGATGVLVTGDPLIDAGKFWAQADFSNALAPMGYPNELNNCEACHFTPTGAAPTYYPVNPAVVTATTYSRGSNAADSTTHLAVSPNAALCSGCHMTVTAAQHMKQNGGDFAAKKDQYGFTVSGSTETCELCHGPGRSADVKVVHDVGGFRYN